jgi:hypothetical protein
MLPIVRLLYPRPSTMMRLGRTEHWCICNGKQTTCPTLDDGVFNTYIVGSAPL